MTLFTYYAVTLEGSFAKITSKGIAGACGELEITENAIRNVFDHAKHYSPSSYYSWLHDPYPVGGSTRLMRIDVSDHPLSGQLILDPDTHPNRGDISFGNPEQEQEQLEEFHQLRKYVESLFEKNKPSEQQLMAAEARAKVINANAEKSFLSPSGYCSCCHSDVTEILIKAPAGEYITGCPVCSRSWCD